MAPTEYGGDSPQKNTVQGLGPNGRKLSTSEQLRLSYLTGQDEDPTTEAKPGFFYGVDPDFPDVEGSDAWRKNPKGSG